MVTEEFNKVREFLEKMLEKDPNHQGFLDAYINVVPLIRPLNSVL